MLVENDKVSINVTLTMFAEQRIAVEIAHTGAQALNCLKQRSELVRNVFATALADLGTRERALLSPTSHF